MLYACGDSRFSEFLGVDGFKTPKPRLSKTSAPNKKE
jgi:hypothetical protein